MIDDFKVIHLSSKDYDEVTNYTDRSIYTYYLKNPIVLNDDYCLMLNYYNLVKQLAGNSISYDSNSTELGRVVDAQNLELQLIVPIQSTFIVENVVVLRNDAIKTPTNARLKLSITPNVPNGTDCTISLLEVTATDTGFAENNLILIDKSQFSSEFTYTNQYAVFLVKSIKNKDIIIRNNTNYGFGVAQIGTWLYNDGGTLIVIQVYTPAGQTTQARILSVNNSRLNYNFDDVITIPNADIKNLATGVYGWGKLYGNLIIDVNDVSPFSTPSLKKEVTLSGVKFKNNTYSNSDKSSDPNTLSIDIVNKGVDKYSNNQITLIPQVINNLTLTSYANTGVNESFFISFILNKKNLY